MSVASSVSVEEIRSLMNSESAEDYEFFCTADVAIIRRLAAENDNNIQAIMSKIGDVVWQEYASDRDEVEATIDDMLVEFHKYNRYPLSDKLKHVAENYLKAAIINLFAINLEKVVKNLPIHSDKEIVAILDAEMLREYDSYEEPIKPLSVRDFPGSLLNLASVPAGLDEVAFLRKIIKENGSFENYMKNSQGYICEEFKKSQGYLVAMNYIDEAMDMSTMIGRAFNPPFGEFLLNVFLDNFENAYNAVVAMGPEKSDEEVLTALVFGPQSPELNEEEKLQAPASPRMRM